MPQESISVKNSKSTNSPNFSFNAPKICKITVFDMPVNMAVHVFREEIESENDHWHYISCSSHISANIYVHQHHRITRSVCILSIYLLVNLGSPSYVGFRGPFGPLSWIFWVAVKNCKTTVDPYLTGSMRHWCRPQPCPLQKQIFLCQLFLWHSPRRVETGYELKDPYSLLVNCVWLFLSKNWKGCAHATNCNR